jgi:hypothetical protein
VSGCPHNPQSQHIAGIGGVTISGACGAYTLVSFANKSQNRQKEKTDRWRRGGFYIISRP